MAIYDLRLDAVPGDTVFASFNAAVTRGVAVRLMFNQDHAKSIPVPPPPEIDWAFVDRLRSAGVQIKPVSGVPDLMHHKYVVRDGADLLSGSTNWTNDSWTREENVLYTLTSPAVAAAFTQNFEELWNRPEVALSGRINTDWITLDDGVRVRPYFCPGRALKLVHAMSRSIASAERRVKVCSPVITSGPILATLAETVQRGAVPISGVYDATQMDEVQHQWAGEATASWKIATFHTVIAGGHFGAKRSIPYAKGSVHDFMHAKILIGDDYTYIGSFNLSHSGETNAENVLQIESAAIADQCAAYIDRVAARYATVTTGG